MEKIEIKRKNPYWVYAMGIIIAASKHESLADEMADLAPIRIYSDGSGLEGCIGAASVMFKRGAAVSDPEIQMSLRKFLGSEEEQTVYVVEQAGELMSLELLWREDKGEVGEALVYIDSQAVLKALQSNKPVSGHQLVDAIHSAYDRVMQKHTTACITFRWITAHKDCIGNEVADKRAKMASSAEHDSPRDDLPEMR